MKKSVLFAVSVAVILAFASMGLADVGHETGHVGHVEDDAWDECEDLSSDDIDAIIASSDLGGDGFSMDITNVSVDQTVKDDFIDNLGDISTADGDVTSVYAVFDITINHGTDPFTRDIVLNFSNTNAANANYIWIWNGTTSEYDAFEVTDGQIVIPMAEAGNYFTTAKAFATTVTPSSSGGSSGCSLGMISPLMGLLFIPLAFLMKK